MKGVVAYMTTGIADNEDIGVADIQKIVESAKTDYDRVVIEEPAGGPEGEKAHYVLKLGDDKLVILSMGEFASIDALRPTGVLNDPDDNYDYYHDMVEKVVCMIEVEEGPLRV